MVTPDCGKDGLVLKPLRVCEEACYTGDACLNTCTKKAVEQCQVERIPGFFQAKCNKVLDSTQFKTCFTGCVKANSKCLQTCTSTNTPTEFKECSSFYQGDHGKKCSLATEVQKCDHQCYAGGKKCEKQCKKVPCGDRQVDKCTWVCGSGKQWCEKLCSKKKMQQCWVERVPQELAAKCMKFLASGPVTACLNKCFFPAVLPK